MWHTEYWGWNKKVSGHLRKRPKSYTCNVTLELQGYKVAAFNLGHTFVAKSCPTLLQPQGLQPTRLLCPWDLPGKNSRRGCHFLLQGILPNKDRAWVSCTTGRFFTTETPGKTWTYMERSENMQVPGSISRYSQVKIWGIPGGVLRFMGLQRVGHDWATELDWTELVAQVGEESTCNEGDPG